MKRSSRRMLSVLFGIALALPLINAQTVTGLMLVNADSDADIRYLQATDTIDFGDVGSSLNVRAEVSGTVGSVRFGLNGNANFRTEGAAPYAMAGDNAGDYWVWTPEAGDNTITATAYSAVNAGGTAGTPVVVNLFVKGVSANGAEGTVYSLPANTGTGDVEISGELKKWHKVTMSFNGPGYREGAVQPNPFLDYRLNVTFSKGSKYITVPGYFAADGNASETSADTGNIWRVHFRPDEEGEWTYTTSFRLEGHIAVNDNESAGIAVAPIDGKTGSLTILANDKTGNDNRAKGRLQYVGGHYLKYSETGEIFVKGGADAPENFLAYEDFDNTPNSGGYRKSWSPHASDYNVGDPSWQGGKGTEIIGAVNYLASEELNVFSFLTMNINGDDKNVYPYVSTSDFFAYDCSKLDQWEIVFDHADSLGMYLHFKTQETENEMLLDNGDTGPERKLYYRELIARFGHHLALNWNLGEENGHYGSTNQNTSQRIAMAQYFAENDPYNNHVVLHTAPGKQNEIYPSLLGSYSEITGASIQTNWSNVHTETAKWVTESAGAGKRWVVANDEQGGANIGVPEDAFTGSPDKHDIRKQTLWGNFMAGGAGVEYYFGYERPQSDLTCQDFRSRDQSWDYVRHALNFLKERDLESMEVNDDLVSSGWCLANEGKSYIIYLLNGGTATLNLPDAETYSVKWYNPRTGGELQNGSVTSISASGQQSIGTAPSETTQDWAILVERDFGGNQLPEAVIKLDSTKGKAPLKVTFKAKESSDPDGTIASYDWNFGDGIVASGDSVVHTYSEGGLFQVTLKVTDNQGGFSEAFVYVNVEKQASSSGCGSQMEILSKDFPYSGTSFYLDTYTDYDLLAINPTPPDPAEASVTTTFSGESCVYNLKFHAVGENDGSSEFKVSVGGTLLGTFIVPLSTESWEVGDKYNFTWEGIEINDGDEIKVEGKTASADVEWSRARWLKVELIPSDCKAGTFIEEEGYLVIEAENTEFEGNGYALRTGQNSLGDGYLEYIGPNYQWTEPQHILTYPIKINTPGTYQFIWRNSRQIDAPTFDAANDSWLKIKADEFYGVNGGTEVDCKDHFMKVWVQKEGFIFECYGEHSGTNNLTIYATFNQAGEYSIEMAGRSTGHVVDRFALFLPEKKSIATNITTPESENNGCSGGGIKDFASKKLVHANMVAENLIIDGVKDPIWENVEQGQGKYEITGAELPTEEDLSFTYHVAYDNTNLYFLAEVTDDILSSYSGSAENYNEFDNLELYFNPDGAHLENGAYGDDALQLRMTLGVTNSKVSGNGTWKASDYSNLKYVTTETEAGYIIEAQIPWDGILPSSITAAEGVSMGFEVQVNDKDNSSEIENNIGWANNTLQDVASTDTRKFGEILLDKKVYLYANKSGWEVIYADSEAPNSNKELAIDRDVNTFWHTVWHNSDNNLRDPLPHEIQIDFKEKLTINQVHYLHRQDVWGPNGAIGEYEIYLSDSDTDWGTAIKTGEIDWPEDLATNYMGLNVIELDTPTAGRYLKLVALTEAQNNPDIPYTAIAELDVVKFVKPSGLRGIDELSDVNIYPNPVSNELNVVFKNSSESIISIYNAIGELVVTNKTNHLHESIDMQNLDSGIYFIRIEQENFKEINKKIIKN